MVIIPKMNMQNWNETKSVKMQWIDMKLKMIKKIILNVLCNVVQLNYMYAITDLLLFYKLKEFIHRSRFFFLILLSKFIKFKLSSGRDPPNTHSLSIRACCIYIHINLESDLPGFSTWVCYVFSFGGSRF